MRVKVHEDRIFVILEPMVTTTSITNKFGETIELELPENHHERSRVGVVQQVGEGTRDPNGNIIPPRFAPGDRVLLSTYAGVRIHLIGREIDGMAIDEDCFRIIRQEEVIAQLFD
ncbi:MAG: hypothetical protein M0R06_09750 [Sphaerochaeta sp.]|nr:hypothetical protein [Sphaerochaeta sp.]